MPDRGLLDLTAVATSQLASAPGGLALRAAHWVQITFEVDQATALGRLPSDAGRPIPAYARLIVVEASASSLGPLKLALLAVGGRYKMLPRNVLADLVIDGPVESVAGAIGGPARAGAVSLEREGPRLVATISADEGPLATLTLPELRAIDPGMLRWDPWLTFAGDDGVTRMAEVPAQAVPSEAFLSKGATLETPAGLGRHHLWRQLRNLRTVSACYCEGDFMLAPPAIQGG